VELVLEEGSSKRLLDGALSLVGVLPLREADLLDDVVDVGDDAFNDDRRVLVLGALEQLGKGRFPQIVFLFGYDFRSAATASFASSASSLRYSILSKTPCSCRAGSGSEEVIEDIRVHHERLEVVPHNLHVDILVNELDRLGAESMPK
jgi:hypothetical protein